MDNLNFTTVATFENSANAWVYRNRLAEFGIDAFWKFQIAESFSFSPDLQAYYSVNDQVNVIPGIRAFFAY